MPGRRPRACPTGRRRAGVGGEGKARMRGLRAPLFCHAEPTGPRHKGRLGSRETAQSNTLVRRPRPPERRARSYPMEVRARRAPYRPDQGFDDPPPSPAQTSGDAPPPFLERSYAHHTQPYQQLGGHRPSAARLCGLVEPAHTAAFLPATGVAPVSPKWGSRLGASRGAEPAPRLAALLSEESRLGPRHYGHQARL